MSSLVSAGTSVTITDESFYIPSSAATVPLIFIATRANKTQPDGASVATGTNEHSVVRTVTSIGQSVSLYGIPYFWKDASGKGFHGDARNEYGLQALNNYLAIGARAYVVRANVDLTDAAETFIGFGKPVSGDVTFVGVGTGSITGISVASALIKPETYDVIFTSATGFTVQGSVSGIIGTGSVGTTFTSSRISFTVTAGSTAYAAGDYFSFETGYQPDAASSVYTGNGKIIDVTAESSAVAQTITITFTGPLNFDVQGSVTGAMGSGRVGFAYSDACTSFMITAGSTAFAAGDTMVLIAASYNLFNPLGANDAAKRVSIATALAAEINTNADVRSEVYEYNLIVCPGYHEVVDELLSLSSAINDEAFVIADVPCDKTPEQAKVWGSTSARQKNRSAAYYYPWGLQSNLDGVDVVVPPSSIALRTYTYNDNQAYVWFAPAGVRRGVVQGATTVGYVSGTLGTATTFVEVSLNQGQRDALYDFGTNINPIMNDPVYGLVVWGQKTSQAVASSLDRVNVVRLLMYIKRALRKGSIPFIFEPNDSVTWADWKSEADGFLSDVLAKRGLYDFVTQCDKSTNTDTRIQNNQMWMYVALKPTLTAEFLYIPIRVLSVGDSMP